MTLYADPEQHAANPPETWEIRRIQYGSTVRWELRIDPEQAHAIQSFNTKKAAEAARREGFYFDMWHKESRWYAGENVANWKPYAEIRAERAAREAKARRKSERAGLDADKMDEWRAAADGRLDESPGAISDLIAELLDWFDQAEPVSLEALTADEAAALHREIAAQWDFTSDVEAELHRVQVLGIGADRTAAEVLESLRQAEREAAEWAEVAA